MSDGYGARFLNDAGYVTVDEEAITYVYLGKYPIPDIGGGLFDITVTCVGYPLVFFSVPYNVGPGNGRTTFVSYQDRIGIQVTKTAPGGAANTWVITVRVAAQNYTGLSLYLRVFGMLHLNFPSGSGEQWGVRFRNSQGQVVFDSGVRQLRLAGNSFSAEMTLKWEWPDLSHFDNNDKCDTSVSMPFDLNNKSICANARGIIYGLHQYDSYTDWDTGQTIIRYYIMDYNAMYWASGSTLYARRICTDTSAQEGVSMPFIDTSRCQNVYTRICAIDNSLYP